MHSLRFLLFFLPSSQCKVLSIYGRLRCSSHFLLELSNICSHYDDADRTKGSHWWSLWRLCFNLGSRWSFSDIYLWSNQRSQPFIKQKNYAMVRSGYYDYFRHPHLHEFIQLWANYGLATGVTKASGSLSNRNCTRSRKNYWLWRIKGFWCQ